MIKIYLSKTILSIYASLYTQDLFLLGCHKHKYTPISLILSTLMISWVYFHPGRVITHFEEGTEDPLKVIMLIWFLNLTVFELMFAVGKDLVR